MSEILISNERWKAFANLLYNLAAGLIAGSAARWWEKEALDLATLSWLVTALALGFVASKSLGFVMSEA